VSWVKFAGNPARDQWYDRFNGLVLAAEIEMFQERETIKLKKRGHH
jgi:hypothetical protein